MSFATFATFDLFLCVDYILPPVSSSFHRLRIDDSPTEFCVLPCDLIGNECAKLAVSVAKFLLFAICGNNWTLWSKIAPRQAVTLAFFMEKIEDVIQDFSNIYIGFGTSMLWLGN